VSVVSRKILDVNLRPLTVGSFKHVYEARLRTDAPVTDNAGLKVPVLQLRHGTATLATELQVFKKLGSHTNLTRLFAVVVNDSGNVSSLVTEFADLGSLDNVLMSLEERGENVIVDVLLTVTLQTLEAILQVQEFQIVHCDLTIRNLFAFETWDNGTGMTCGLSEWTTLNCFQVDIKTHSFMESFHFSPLSQITLPPTRLPLKTHTVHSIE